MNRCGKCMEPHRAHHQRMAAAPACPNGSGSYREGTADELAKAYAEAFPEGPKPIATFENIPEGITRAKTVLSPAALNSFFGAGGGGMPAFIAAVEVAQGIETAKAAETAGLGPKDESPVAESDAP